MLSDRGQKSRALQYVVSRDWFPQLELDVTTSVTTGLRSYPVTDIDLYAVIPDDLGANRAILIDCKTKKSESPISRSLWQKGLMDYLSVESGICIIRKARITNDHRLSANSFGVTLLNDEEFEAFARSTSARFAKIDAAVADIDVWDRFLEFYKSNPKLTSARDFSKSEFWMLPSESEACRRALYVIRKMAKELDPDKPQHCAVVADLSALFSLALSRLIRRLFSGYLLPETRETLSEALLIIIYGGREAYEFRNSLVKQAFKKSSGETFANLELPEWERFVRLCRQLLDAPMETQYTPKVLREVAFNYMADSKQERKYLREFVAFHQQAARFAILSLDYVIRATKLPSDFSEQIGSQIFRAMNGNRQNTAARFAMAGEDESVNSHMSVEDDQQLADIQPDLGFITPPS